MREDAELLEGWRRGDGAAGSELFERHYPSIVRFFANKVSGDPADLIQETFEACVTGRDRLREGGSFSAYLFGVAYNVLRRHYERTRTQGERFDPSTVSSADLSPGPATMMNRRDEERLLLAALRRIPLELQVVLELFYWEERTPGDPNPATWRAFGSKYTGSLGVRRWLPVLPSALGYSR